MVDTMALLRAFIRTARMARNTSRLAAGLPADDEVLLDAPDDRLGPALVGAGRGEYGPAAGLLAATRAAAGWEDRDRYTRRLAAFARSAPSGSRTGAPPPRTTRTPCWSRRSSRWTAAGSRRPAPSCCAN